MVETVHVSDVYMEMFGALSAEGKLDLISKLVKSMKKTVVPATVVDKNVKLHISREDLELTPFVSTIGMGIIPLPADFDYDKAKQDYLTQKYG